DGAIAPDAALSENDNSLVIKIEYGGRALLFAGDVEKDGEALLVARRGQELRADVLKVPHHGSRTSSTDALLDAVRPLFAVISVGHHNRWHFPHPSVLARYRKRGVSVLRTDERGAITIEVSASGRILTETIR